MTYATPQSKGGPGEEVIQLDWLNLLKASISVYLVPDVNQTRGYANGEDQAPGKPRHVFSLIDCRSRISEENTRSGLFLIPPALAVLLTDSLAHLSSETDYLFTSLTSPSGPWENGTTLPLMTTNPVTNKTIAKLDQSGVTYAMAEIGYYQMAYGYGFTTTAIILSWTVLFLHLGLVLVHLVTVAAAHRGWSSGAWGHLGEVVTLALNSRRPEGEMLRNTGGGVERWRTWRLKVLVREGGSGE